MATQQTLNCRECFEKLTGRNSFRLDLLEDFFPCLEPEDINSISLRINWINFSIIFKNKYPDKLYLVKDRIKWWNFSQRTDLTEEMVIELDDYVHFKELKNKVITNRLIDLYGERLNPKTIGGFIGISDKNVEKYKNHLDWSSLVSHYTFTLNEIKKYYDYLKDEHLTRAVVGSGDESIIRKYEKELDFSKKMGFHRLPLDILDRHIDEIAASNTWIWSDIKKNNNLTKQFIMKWFDQLTEESTQNSSKRSIYKVLKRNGLLKREDRSDLFEDFLME